MHFDFDYVRERYGYPSRSYWRLNKIKSEISVVVFLQFEYSL